MDRNEKRIIGSIITGLAWGTFLGPFAGMLAGLFVYMVTDKDSHKGDDVSHKTYRTFTENLYSSNDYTIRSREASQHLDEWRSFNLSTNQFHRIMDSYYYQFYNLIYNKNFTNKFGDRKASPNRNSSESITYSDVKKLINIAYKLTEREIKNSFKKLYNYGSYYQIYKSTYNDRSYEKAYHENITNNSSCFSPTIEEAIKRIVESNY